MIPRRGEEHFRKGRAVVGEVQGQNKIRVNEAIGRNFPVMG